MRVGGQYSGVDARHIVQVKGSYRPVCRLGKAAHDRRAGLEHGGKSTLGLPFGESMFLLQTVVIGIPAKDIPRVGIA